MIDNFLPNYSELNREDGKIYGQHNVVTTINPYTCFFVATYPNNLVIKSRNGLIDTGWDDLPNGLIKLQYVLSNGITIDIPRYKAYKPLIEVSFGVDGSRVFHCINVNCLDQNSIVVDKIILKQDWYSKYKIGDRVLSRTYDVPTKFDKSWKFTS